MSKTVKMLLIALGVLIVAGAIATAYYFGGKSKNGASVVPPGWKDNASPADKAGNKSDQINPKNYSYETYTTSDQKVSVKYPKDWIKSEVGEASGVVGKDLASKYNVKIPLIASRPSQEGLMQISLSYYEFTPGLSPDDAINQLLSDSQTPNTKVETVAKKNNTMIAVMENKYVTKELNIRAKEKVMYLAGGSGKQPAYIASMTVLEKDWVRYAAVANYIIDSAVLLNSNTTDIPAASVGTALP